MAFGLLNSIIPDPNSVLNLYTGPAGKLTVGKITIGSKNYDPSRIQIGYKDGSDVRYFEYNRYVKYGEVIETENIYLGEGQELVVRSTEPDVNFLFYGQTYSDTVNPQRSGVLSHTLSTGTTKQAIYTAPAGSQSSVTISIVNMGPDVSTVKLGISNGGLNDFDSTEYLDYGFDIGPGQTYTRPNIKLDAGQSLIGFSNPKSKVSFLCHGRLYYAVSGLPTSDDFMVLGNARITGNIGVGTTAAVKLDVLGDAQISGMTSVGHNLTVGGGLEVVGMSTFSGISVNSGNITITSIDTNRMFQVGVATFRGTTKIEGETANFQTNTFKAQSNQVVLGFGTATTFRAYATGGSDIIFLNQQLESKDLFSNNDLINNVLVSVASVPQGSNLTLNPGTRITGKYYDDTGRARFLTLSNPISGNGNAVCTFSVNGPDDNTAANGGIVIKGTVDKHILWRQSLNAFEFTQGIKLNTGTLAIADQNATISIGVTNVLTADTVLGCGIVTAITKSSTDTEIPTARATYLAARNLQALNYWLASSNR